MKRVALLVLVTIIALITTIGCHRADYLIVEETSITQPAPSPIVEPEPQASPRQTPDPGIEDEQPEETEKFIVIGGVE